MFKQYQIDIFFESENVYVRLLISLFMHQAVLLNVFWSLMIIKVTLSCVVWVFIYDTGNILYKIQSYYAIFAYKYFFKEFDLKVDGILYSSLTWQKSGAYLLNCNLTWWFYSITSILKNTVTQHI